MTPLAASQACRVLRPIDLRRDLHGRDADSPFHVNSQNHISRFRSRPPFLSNLSLARRYFNALKE